MAALLGAGIGAAAGLIYTAVKDLFENDGPDQQKIQQVQQAINSREQELIAGGSDPMEAYQTSRSEFKQALEDASQDTDGTTFGDYIGNMATGAGIGAGAAMIPAVGRGLTAGVGKLKSFLPASGAEKAMVGATSDIRGMGAASLNPAAAPGRMPAVGKPSMAPPGPGGMPYTEPPSMPAPVVRDSVPVSEFARAETLTDDALAASGVSRAWSPSASFGISRPPLGRPDPMSWADDLAAEKLVADRAAAAAAPSMRAPGAAMGWATKGDRVPVEDMARIDAIIDDALSASGVSKPWSPPVGGMSAAEQLRFAARAQAGRVPMPTIDPRQGAMSIPSFLR